MNDFFKYLAPNPEEKNWGIYLTVAGCATILPGMSYPPGKHPGGYHFRWENGRILNEYQLVYITEGEGIYETRQEKMTVKPGTVMLLHPGEWHRYKPKPNKGWVEMYIGINGEIIQRMMSDPMLTKFPAVCCGLKEKVQQSYHRIFSLVQDEKPGFQLLASGEVVKLISMMLTHLKYQDVEGKPATEFIENSRFLIRQNFDQKIDFQNIAKSMNIGYSNFRKLFKKYTRISPSHYHLNLRLIKAKELLIHSDKTMKEIAWETGFSSESYFSRIFKEKMGQSPSALRK